MGLLLLMSLEEYYKIMESMSVLKIYRLWLRGMIRTMMVESVIVSSVMRLCLEVQPKYEPLYSKIYWLSIYLLHYWFIYYQH